MKNVPFGGGGGSKNRDVKRHEVSEVVEYATSQSGQLLRLEASEKNKNG